MVEHHVQKHHQPQIMRCCHQRGQIFRCPITVLRGPGQHRVIAPSALAGELAHRHDLNRGNPAIGQALQIRRYGGCRERPFAGEGADVHLAKHRLVKRPSAPIPRLGQVTQVAQHRPPLDALGLLQRRRVGERHPGRREQVPRAVLCPATCPIHAILPLGQRDGRAAVVKLQQYRFAAWSPNGEVPFPGRGRPRTPEVRLIYVVDGLCGHR